jgi:hypothetical protein
VSTGAAASKSAAPTPKPQKHHVKALLHMVQSYCGSVRGIFWLVGAQPLQAASGVPLGARSWGKKDSRTKN